jgi:hypothetical protein
LSLGLLNRRTERRRLARAEKTAIYPELVEVASRLSDLPVWPGDREPAEHLRQIEVLVSRVAFLGPRGVAVTLGPVLDAARELAGIVRRIRTESVPGHRDQVDQRLAPLHRANVIDLRHAVNTFATAAREPGAGIG